MGLKVRIARARLRQAAVVGICLLLLSTAVSASVLSPGPGKPAMPAASPKRGGAIPRGFETNQGQTHPSVRYFTRGADHTLFLTDREFVFAFEDGTSPLRLRFAETARQPAVTGETRLETRTNYFAGNNPSKWVTGVESFARVRYDELYPGIDALLYENGNRIEHDFVASPGADPRRIAMDVDGARGARIDPAGDLVLETRAGKLRLQRPAAYQNKNGERRNIPVRFRLDGKTRIGFDLGAFDPALPLVIDPVISYSTFVGGGGDESTAGVVVDATGAAYTVGGTSSIDFPVTAGVQQPALVGTSDGFVAKVNPQGTGYVFCTYLGGGGSDAVARVAIDATGVYVVGGTDSTDFPVTAGAFQTTFAGGDFDAFLTKLNLTGSALVFSTYIGGSAIDAATAVAADASGSVYITGASTSSNYPVTPGAFDTNNTTLIGLPDAFVTKFNSTGTALVYSTYLGGSFNLDGGSAIAVDASGAAYVSGATNGGFPTTAGAFDRSANGSFDAFMAKLNAAGSNLLFSTYFGGGGEDYAFSMALDSAGNAYFTGYTSSVNLPVQGAFQPANAGGFDAFVTKLNASGATLAYSSYLGGSGAEGVTSNGGFELSPAGAIAIDSTGAAYVTGFTNSTDFPVTTPWQPSPGGGFDAFVTKVNPGGSAKIYSSYLGGGGDERGLGIAADTSGSAYVTGATLSPNFPSTAGVAQPGAPALGNGFLSKIGAGPGDTPGVFVPATGAWFPSTANASGPAATAFFFGPANSTLIPLAGDWDGNGTVSAGLFDPATGAFFLKNSNSSGPADLTFFFGVGGAGIRPVAGDWNGDGRDTIGLYLESNGTFFLRNSNDAGPADLAFSFGLGGAGIRPVVGDWNGDGLDTIGLYLESNGTFFLRNDNSSGNADLAFPFGVGGAGILPVTGDWNADGTDSVGLHDTAFGAWFLRDANSSGPADLTFFYASPNVTPLAGHWGG